MSAILQIIVSSSPTASVRKNSLAIKQWLIENPLAGAEEEIKVSYTSHGLQVEIPGEPYSLAKMSAQRLTVEVTRLTNVRSVTLLPEVSEEDDQYARESEFVCPKNLKGGGAKNILTVLYINNRTLDSFQIAEVLKSDPHNISKTLRRLKAAGLVMEIGERDGRRKKFQISDSGKAFGPKFDNLPAIKPAPVPPAWGQRTQARLEVIRVMFNAQRALTTVEIVEASGVKRASVNKVMLHGASRKLVTVSQQQYVRGGPHTYVLTQLGREAAAVFLATTLTLNVTIEAASLDRATELRSLVQEMLGAYDEIRVKLA